MKKTVGFLLLILLMPSCAVERVNLSPLSSSFSGYSTGSFISNTGKSLSTVGYTSELTNLMAEFPAFSNEKLNREIDTLKIHLSDYVYAVKKNNAEARGKAYEALSLSYKTLQQLKNGLSAEEGELLNRFLVKIKTNISLIDAINITEIN